jgi:outer membrane lipopolysaccharide assembly protein LptE/RlpB
MITEMDYYEELREISVKGAREILVQFNYMQERTFVKKGLLSVFKKADYSSLVGHGEMLKKEIESIVDRLQSINGTTVDNEVAMFFTTYFTVLKASLNMLIQINERLYMKAKKVKDLDDKEYADLVNYFIRMDENRIKLQKEMADVIKEVFM